MCGNQSLLKRKIKKVFFFYLQQMMMLISTYFFHCMKYLSIYSQEKNINLNTRGRFLAVGVRDEGILKAYKMANNLWSLN